MLSLSSRRRFADTIVAALGPEDERRLARAALGKEVRGGEGWMEVEVEEEERLERAGSRSLRTV